MALSSNLFAEASSSSDPRALMVRTVQRFAPATLERYSNESGVTSSQWSEEDQERRRRTEVAEVADGGVTIE